MGLLHLFLLAVHAVLQGDHLLHMAFVASGEHINGIPDQLDHHVQQLSQFSLCFFADGDARLFPQPGRIRHVLGVISYALNVIHHMEYGAQTLQVLNGQGGLVDFHQVVRDGVIQEVDILLHLVDFAYILFIQRNQGIHGPSQILAGQGSHAVQLLDDLHHRSGRVKDHLVSYVFELIALPVIDLFVLTGHTQTGQLYNPLGEREQNDDLENLDHGMGVCHKPSVVRGYGPDNFHHGLLGHKQNDIQNGRADHIEPEVNQRCPLGVLFT